MKHSQIITLLLCLAVATTSPAQFFERNFQTDFYNKVEALRWGENGTLFCTTRGGDQSSFQPISLHRIDYQGNEESFLILPYGIPLDYDWLPVPGGYIATVRYFECDIIIPRTYFYFDELGSLIWEKEVDSADPAAYDDVKLLPGPGNTYWVFNNDKPVQYDLDGNVVDTASIPLPLFNGYLTTGSGSLLVYGSGVMLCDPALTFLQFGLQNEVVLKAAMLPDGRFAALTSEKLLLLNSDLSVLEEIDHGIAIIDGVQADLAAGAGGIWLLSKDSPRKLFHYDTSLALMETHTVPPSAPFQPALLAAAGDRLVLAGEEYGAASSQVVSIRSTPADAISFDATPDVALTDLISVYPPIGYNHPFEAYHTIVFDSVIVTLKNEGSGVLDEVTLNAVLGHDNFICQVTYSYRKHFTGLNLLPGNSIQIELGEIVQYDQFPLPATTTLCFWTTLPNDSLDQVSSNNSVCKTFTVIVAISDPPAPAPLRITPNPATNYSLVQWPGEAGKNTSVRLYDMTGRLLRDIRVSGNEWTLQRTNLPAGTYQIVVSDDDGRVFTGKIVFE